MSKLVARENIENEEFKKKLAVSRYSELVNQVLRTAKLCIKSDPNCTKDIIRAHSIQNNGILKQISQNGLVLALDAMTTVPVLYEPDVSLIKISRKKATVFPGFCNHHDTKIFAPIEVQPYIGSYEQHFLYAYRSFAKWYSTLLLMHKIRSEVIKLIIRDDYKSLEHYFPSHNPYLFKQSFYNAEFRKSFKAMNNTMARYERLRHTMNEYLDASNFDKIETAVIEFEREYPFAVSDVFHLASDVYGNIVNEYNGLNYNHSDLYINVFPQAGKTHVLLSYLERDKEKYAFIEEQILEQPVEKQKIILSNMLAIYSNNIVISPDWWEGITNEKQERELFLMLNQIRKQGNYPETLVLEPEFNIFV